MEVTQKPHLHRDWIDPHAYGIVKALQKSGHQTYLVGGCVRDLLVGIHPKDFDIATMAHPPQVRRLIYMSYIIGKRFRLVLVKREDQQFEVATFRREFNPDDFPEGAPPGDNVFGTPEEDACRRDFTINALFYDPINDQLIDFVNGLDDIDHRTLRMIGEPDLRLAEDPIRILRGLRLAHKLNFQIEGSLRDSMTRMSSEILKSVLPRRREEILKFLRLPDPARALLELFDLGILKYVIPTLHDLITHPERRELFLGLFDTYRNVVVDPTQPVELFGWLVYSMLQTALQGPTDRETPLKIEDEVFQNLMREELGMYKFEQAALIKAVELLPSIQRVNDFSRRGERRQLSLIKNEGFKLGLQIAKSDFIVSPHGFQFWQDAVDRLAPDLGHSEGNSKSRRKRTRKRRGSSHRDVDAKTDPAKSTSASADDHDSATSIPDGN